MKQLTIILLIFMTIMPIMLFSKQAADKATTEKNIWFTDFDQAMKVAQARNVPILIDFTGSDWCIWCKKLTSEVFDKKVFTDYAKKNLVLLKIDFPRAIPQTVAEKKKNQELQQKYKVEGYPSIILVNASGTEINRTGYQTGGPVKYVNHIKDLLSKQSE